MLTKFALAFAIVAVVASFAGNLPAVAHITLTEPVVISGTTFQAGDYRLLIGDAKVTFTIDRHSVDIPAKIEMASRKFDENQIESVTVGAQTVVTEIAIGGTKTRLIFQ